MAMSKAEGGSRNVLGNLSESKTRDTKGDPQKLYSKWYKPVCHHTLERGTGSRGSIIRQLPPGAEYAV